MFVYCFAMENFIFHFSYLKSALYSKVCAMLRNPLIKIIWILKLLAAYLLVPNAWHHFLKSSYNKVLRWPYVFLIFSRSFRFSFHERNRHKELNIFAKSITWIIKLTKSPNCQVANLFLYNCKSCDSKIEVFTKLLRIVFC